MIVAAIMLAMVVTPSPTCRPGLAPLPVAGVVRKLKKLEGVVLGKPLKKFPIFLDRS
jgi:hypothetical protein